jgi:ubiquinone/menaquinone biosynthesis C-methylase UbiE
MGVWNRVFAAAYDPFLAVAERKGLADARRSLLAGAHGRVLEIGAGTGLNFPHYPAGVEPELTEPDPSMAKRLRRHGEVTLASADDLPFPDASFDTVVSTLVFCTVPDLPRALAEVRRVLKPGGQLLFLEHVRAEPCSKLERWQDRLHGPWHAFACGCNCNRDFLGALPGAGFSAPEVERHEWRFMPALVRPIVVGSAS